MNQNNEEQAYDQRINLDELPKPQLNGHMWRQQGNSLICMSCPFIHTTFISADQQLVGFDDQGRPIIKTLEF